MAMNLQNRYSNMLFKKIEATLTAKDGVVFNTTYEGDPKAGVVKVPKRNNAVAKDYTPASGLAADQINTDYVDVLINKDKAVHEVIDGYQADAVPDNVLANRLDSAGDALAQALDTDGIEVLSNATNTVTAGAITPQNVYQKIILARTALSKKNVPVDNRFLLVTPEVYAALLENPKFIDASKLADDTVQSGIVGRVAGFNVIECNKLSKVNFVAGHPYYCARVKEWKVAPTVENAGGNFIGASAVKGRLVYGHAILDQDGLVVEKNA